MFTVNNISMHIPMWWNAHAVNIGLLLTALVDAANTVQETSLLVAVLLATIFSLWQ